MNLNLLSLSHGQLHWTDSFPPAFKAVRLPGSTIATSVGDFGSVCIQEYTTENFFIRFNVFDLLQQFVTRSFFQQPGLLAKLVIKGRTDLQLDKQPAIPLRQNQFAVITKETIVQEETFDNKIHITLDTFLSEKLSFEIKQLFPGSKSITSAMWAGIEVSNTLQSILRCKYENELRRHFFESQVKDLFFKYLFITANQPEVEIKATDDELKAVYKAEELISNDITDHYSIPEIAKKVFLNEFRLKLLFKKVFGAGPYEYLVNKRMAKGKELLESGLSVKEVAAQTGYRPSDFTTAFRNHFGSPPSHFKKPNS
jgi:AraC-like DNA-binding protein